MFLLNLILALAWMAFQGAFTVESFIGGFLIGYFALWMSGIVVGKVGYFNRVNRIFYFVVYFVWELIVANVQVAYEVITPGFNMKPGVVAIPLDLDSDAEITTLANLITLTPGTLSLDVSADRKTLYVHAMHIDDIDKFREGIKNGFEQRVKEVFAPTDLNNGE